MPDLTNQQTLDAQRSWRAMVLLSLDLTLPTYEAMGLEVPDKLGFVSELRRLIVWRQSDFAARPLDAAFVSHVAGQMTKSLGESVWKRFVGWLTYVYVDFPGERPHTYAWWCILRRCAGIPDLWARLKLPQGKSVKLLGEFRDKMDRFDTAVLYESPPEDHLSKWDS
ncbi:MAG: hypothetical protein IAF94_24005, partial [Pirellulaceae bacterium]|nr:hypothetical protein [Pirellulaceae bacterium]